MKQRGEKTGYDPTDPGTYELREKSEINPAQDALPSPRTATKTALLYDLYSQAPSPEAAADVLHQYDRLYDDQPPVQGGLFALRVLRTCKEDARAEQWFQRLKEQNLPFKDEDVYQTGLVYAAFGKNREAIDWLFEARPLYPSNETI